jgi:hypothetical protein
MKVVINGCFGGFTISREALALMVSMGYEPDEFEKDVIDGKKDRLGRVGDGVSRPSVERNDPRLVAAVEKLGDRASGSCSRLKVVEIPDDIEWEISEYDGLESVEEAHRSWG